MPDLKPLSVMQREHSHALVLLPKQDADARVAGLQCWYHVDSWSRPAQQGCFDKCSHKESHGDFDVAGKHHNRWSWGALGRSYCALPKSIAKEWAAMSCDWPS